MRREAFVLVLLALVSSSALALPSRVFVKSTGMDVGACPITAPCRSFSYAIAQVAAAGEVIALDTAGYGPFVVTQSVSVFAAPGATAFIAVNSGTGILIDSPVSTTDVFVLRGLALTGTGGNIGIDAAAGHSVAIESCIISGFLYSAVYMHRVADITRPGMRIEHSTVRNNSGGIVITNSGAGLPAVGLTISNSTFSSNANCGICSYENARVAVTDTSINGSTRGIQAVSTDNGLSQINVERCVIAGNDEGILAGVGGSQNPRVIVRIAHNVITGNTTGITENSDGRVMTMTSAGMVTNTIEANGTDGTFTGTYTAK